MPVDGATNRLPKLDNSVVVSAPPPGLVSFGGYRFVVGELTSIISGLDPSGTLAVRPDTLVGHRLVGTAVNQEAS